MSTEEAFEEMLTDRKVQHRLGITSGYKRCMKHDITKVSLQKKIDLLLKSGYAMVQEIRWEPVNTGQGQ